jgi:lipopolysaccharide assembly protein A
MQAIVWILRLAILLVLVWFAVRNGQEVELRGLPDQSWKAPLIFVVLVAFLTGVVIGLSAWLPTYVRQRREISRLRKAPSVTAAVPVPAPEAPPAPAPATVAVREAQDAHGI